MTFLGRGAKRRRRIPVVLAIFASRPCTATSSSRRSARCPHPRCRPPRRAGPGGPGSQRPGPEVPVPQAPAPRCRSRRSPVPKVAGAQGRRSPRSTVPKVAGPEGAGPQGRGPQGRRSRRCRSRRSGPEGHGLGSGRLGSGRLCPKVSLPGVSPGPRTGLRTGSLISAGSGWTSGSRERLTSGPGGRARPPALPPPARAVPAPAGRLPLTFAASTINRCADASSAVCGARSPTPRAASPRCRRWRGASSR